MLGFPRVKRCFVVERRGIDIGNLVNWERTRNIHIGSTNVFAGRNVVSSESRVPESIISFIKGFVGIIGGIRGRSAYFEIVSVLISGRIGHQRIINIGATGAIKIGCKTALTFASGSCSIWIVFAFGSNWSSETCVPHITLTPHITGVSRVSRVSRVSSLTSSAGWASATS